METSQKRQRERRLREKRNEKEARRQDRLDQKRRDASGPATTLPDDPGSADPPAELRPGTTPVPTPEVRP